MKKILKIIPAAIYLLPVFLFAADGYADLSFASTSLQSFKVFILSLFPIIIGFAVLLFMWGLVKYVTAKEDDEKKEARSIILWGLIVLAVMVSVWGLVAIVQGIFGVDSSNSGGLKAPGIPK